MSTEKLTNDNENFSQSTSNHNVFQLNNDIYASTIEMTTIQLPNNTINTLTSNESTFHTQSNLTDLYSYSNVNILSNPQIPSTNIQNSFPPLIPFHLKKYFFLSIFFLFTGLFLLTLSFILSFSSKQPSKYVLLLICSFIISLPGVYFSFQFFRLKRSSQIHTYSHFSSI